jgi:hypothetical protein
MEENKQQTGACPVIAFALLADKLETAKHSPKALLKILGVVTLIPILFIAPGVLVNLSKGYSLLRFEVINSACLFLLSAFLFYCFTFGFDKAAKQIAGSRILSVSLFLIMLGLSFAFAFFVSGLMHPIWKLPELTGFDAPLFIALVWFSLVAGILYLIFGD